MGLWDSFAAGAVTGIVGDIANGVINSNAYEDSLAGSMTLANYNHNLQMDLFEKTGYEGQMRQMQNAGLNPAMMYKNGGSSGQTNSSMPTMQKQPIPSKVMDGAMMGMQAATTQANIELMKSQAYKNNVEAKRLEEGKGNESDASLNLKELELKFNTENFDTALQSAKATLNNTEADTAKKVADGTISEIDAKTRNWKNTSEVLNTIMNTKAVKEGIKQKWEEIKIAQQNADSNTSNAVTNAQNASINQQNADQNVLNTKIKEFEANLKSEYPTIWNVVGKTLNDFIGLGDNDKGEHLYRTVK